jgi:hypothetical protein
MLAMRRLWAARLLPGQVGSQTAPPLRGRVHESEVKRGQRRKTREPASACLVPRYRGTINHMKQITRVQTNVRLETRLAQVLKALATELDLSVGDLLEGIVLHAFAGRAPFSAATLKKINSLKSRYRLDLIAEDSHRLREADGND